ncbi:hypothetical protein ABIB85_004460 [Bradyrhizobium sp. JR1.5]
MHARPVLAFSPADVTARAAESLALESELGLSRELERRSRLQSERPTDGWQPMPISRSSSDLGDTPKDLGQHVVRTGANLTRRVCPANTNPSDCNGATMASNEENFSPDWAAIRRRYEGEHCSIRKLARDFHTTDTTIHRRAKREGWTHFAQPHPSASPVQRLGQRREKSAARSGNLSLGATP